jgi:phage shock protein A
MNPAMLKAMKAKKKRPVDPNAPPRPNLMTHNVKIRTMEEALAQMEQQLQQATHRVDALERKLQSQTAYLQGVHNTVSGLTQRKR